jgi:hypothetical protein
MNNLRELHLSPGCIFAPILIFFAVTGSWQMFSLHRGTKDGGYIPSRPLVVLSGVHQYQHLPTGGNSRSTPLRYFILAGAIGLVSRACLGIDMAFRHGGSRAKATGCLIAGVAIPLVFLLIWH